MIPTAQDAAKDVPPVSHRRLTAAALRSVGRRQDGPVISFHLHQAPPKATGEAMGWEPR